ncbi:hypothetical protein BT96DRAFT_943714 [Gymnopus androsaceus JB14]|uniref:Hydrophobin n=1 Tax=Gymnopus androsaceus JB14 TaxID=1447944 RepID=A0A6A4H7I3_9AGAR|nr:hypothetical protein BT96DRAFT_943714 [Gymnopus androsaceus JB14]
MMYRLISTLFVLALAQSLVIGAPGISRDTSTCVLTDSDDFRYLQCGYGFVVIFVDFASLKLQCPYGEICCKDLGGCITPITLGVGPDLKGKSTAAPDKLLRSIWSKNQSIERVIRMFAGDLGAVQSEISKSARDDILLEQASELIQVNFSPRLPM